MMHTIEIWTERNTGADMARCGDLTARSLKSCAARKLARLMVGEGATNGPVEARGLDGQIRYRVPSLHAFARLIVTEEPGVGLQYWREHPRQHSRYEAIRAVEREKGIGIARRGKKPLAGVPSALIVEEQTA